MRTGAEESGARVVMLHKQGGPFRIIVQNLREKVSRGHCMRIKRVGLPGLAEFEQVAAGVLLTWFFGPGTRGTRTCRR